MKSIKTCVVALVAILSVVAAAENQQLETSESVLSSRSLLGKGKCRTRKWAQCGGKANGGTEGAWRCCPKGYYCKEHNEWYYSCQKSRHSSSATPASPTSTPTPEALTSTLTSEALASTATPEAPISNPTPEAPISNPTPEAPISTSTPEALTSNPTPEAPTPASLTVTTVQTNSNKMLKDGGAYNPDEFDPCAKILPQMKENSHWCKFPKVKRTPSRAGLKVDRQSMYNGPIGHLGYCNKQLEGQAEIAGLAVSTKYLAKNGWAFGTDPYCGKCACLRVTGNDYWVNPTPNPPEWVNSVGTIIKGQVIDMCPECCDDHIDILLDRGYSTAPVEGTNPRASEVNALPGLRPIPLNIASAVGVWTIEWDWLDDCSQSCDANFFQP